MSLEPLHARGEERDRRGDRGLPLHTARTARTSASGCSTASACTTPGCCRSTACWSSSSPSAACSRSSAAPTRWAWASTCRSAPCSSPGSASSTARRRRILTARDFHQIAGRAGRKGFDDRGCVVAQAPGARDREPAARARRRKDGKKVVKRKPPEHNFVHWDQQTFERLIERPARAARLALPGDARDAAERAQPRGGDGCRAMQRLIRDCHEPDRGRRRRTAGAAWQLFRALVERGIVEFIPRTADGGQAARQRRAAGRLLAGPGAVALPGRDDPAARPRVARRTRSTCSRWSSRSSRTRS